MIKQKPITYKVGNPWQKDRYAFMAEYNHQHVITEYAKPPNGKDYFGHLLARNSKNELHQFLGEQEILDEVEARDKRGKLGDYNRLLTNTVASQPCCFNLFAPLQRRSPLASALFSRLLGKEVKVRHIEIEFTPYVTQADDRHLEGFPFGGNESLGDQSRRGGTDADVAVFYTFGAGKRGVILLEFKYIEAEFSVCTSYREKNGSKRNNDQAKNIRPVCDSTDFYTRLIAHNLDTDPKPAHPDCGYLKYNNWQLLEPSEVFDKATIKNFGHCPFRHSLQQLWRNMLLAENVAGVRALNEFHFWVLAPEKNIYLWEDRGGTNVQTDFQKILKPSKREVFKCKYLQKDFVENLKGLTKDDWELQWIEKFEERYL